jgi:tetratricopeptide (TPR) repeat protein
MSEMLGNQYFMARNFKAAIPVFENALLKDPQNKAIQKKLIICYLTSDSYFRALNLFHSLVKEDIEFIANTNVELDDCPCPEIIEKTKSRLSFGENSFEMNLSLGMLWLYCDINNSILYFKEALDQEPQNPVIKEILEIELFYKNKTNMIQKSEAIHD